MTALPAIKPLRLPSLPAKASGPGVSPLPPECRGSGYSFAAAGRDCCHCAEYGEYRDEWLEHPDSLLAFHALVNHIHTCPACRAVAASLPAVTATVTTSWLPSQTERAYLERSERMET